MARKFGLGKGLDALLPADDDELSRDGDAETSLDEDPVPAAANGGLMAKAGGASTKGPASGGVVMISPDKLVPNPGQPRKNFDEAELRELADSIAEHGVIQPIIAADGGDGTCIIIAGERRTRAARIAGLAEVPVIIRNYTDQKRMEISLIENIQRADLNPIEEASAYKNLMDFSRLSQDEVAARVGKNRSTVANALRLLKLSADIQKCVEEGTVSAGHARALLSVIDKKNREKLFREILAGGLSVREAEKRAAVVNSVTVDANGKQGGEEAASKRPVEIADMEEKFISKLGTKVVIEGDLNKGRIRIDYYSMEDLDRLYGIIFGAPGDAEDAKNSGNKTE
jgi:ParB family chromosome partitioning protein